MKHINAIFQCTKTTLPANLSRKTGTRLLIEGASGNHRTPYTRQHHILSPWQNRKIRASPIITECAGLEGIHKDHRVHSWSCTRQAKDSVVLRICFHLVCKDRQKMDRWTPLPDKDLRGFKAI